MVPAIPNSITGCLERLQDGIWNTTAPLTWSVAPRACRLHQEILYMPYTSSNRVCVGVVVIICVAQYIRHSHQKIVRNGNIYVLLMRE